MPLLLALAGPPYHEGQRTPVRILDMLPTQGVVGRAEVAFRAEEARAERDKGEEAFKTYLKGKRKTAVIGPGGQLYLIDGHHLASALLSLGVDTMYVTIEKDYSKLSEKEFWKKMKKKDWVYLGPKDNRILPSQLPKSLANLKDDPFRSLAWMLQTLGAFQEIDRPFHEFKWADFFRKRMTITGDSKEAWRAAIETGWRLALSREASDLKGYIGGKRRCPEDFSLLRM